MLERYTDGLIPTPHTTSEQDIDHQLKRTAEALPALIDKYLANLEFNKALETILGLVQLSNQYIDKTAPWTLAKKPEGTARLHTVLFNMSQIPGFLCATLYPFLPVKAEEMKNQMGLKWSISTFRFFDNLKWGMVCPGTQIRKGDPLFPRIDIKAYAKETKNRGEHSQVQVTGRGEVMEKTQVSLPQEPPSGIIPSTLSTESQITIEDFQKIQFRVGKILAAERVPKSQKLLKLQVDLGSRPTSNRCWHWQKIRPRIFNRTTHCGRGKLKARQAHGSRISRYGPGRGRQRSPRACDAFAGSPRRRKG